MHNIVGKFIITFNIIVYLNIISNKVILGKIIENQSHYN